VRPWRHPPAVLVASHTEGGGGAPIKPPGMGPWYEPARSAVIPKRPLFVTALLCLSTAHRARAPVSPPASGLRPRARASDARCESAADSRSRSLSSSESETRPTRDYTRLLAQSKGSGFPALELGTWNTRIDTDRTQNNWYGRSTKKDER
jgi:hypothetical protein